MYESGDLVVVVDSKRTLGWGSGVVVDSKRTLGWGSARNKGFVDRHRQAFKEFMSGVANIVFPFGTYWWRKFGRMPCEPDLESGLDSAACFA
jgi:hypothetical protein